MNRIIVVLLTALLLLNLQPVFAGWSAFADVDDVEVFVDFDSLVKTEQSAKLSVMLSYAKGRTIRTKIFSSIDSIEFHCQKLLLRRVSMRNFSGLMGQGTEVFASREVGAWQPINLFGLDYEIRTMACAASDAPVQKASPQSNNG
jgi:hypothetical protein